MNAIFNAPPSEARQGRGAGARPPTITQPEEYGPAGSCKTTINVVTYLH
ncbi:hypothetical protein DR64_7760 [Paraburkholderia xenovorans LB400]|nr:hypothetical protein DR64_7760 [Paraburkholderia xenovorans LB400]